MKLPSLKSLNESEMTIGGIFGLVFAFKVGWWALILWPACSYLWAAGGAKKEDGGNKLYRRLGCPLVAVLAVWLVWRVWYVWLALPAAFGVLCIGYGIPTTKPPDEGSLIGRWAFKVAGQKERLAEIITRSVIYLLLALAFIPCWVAR